MARTRLKGIKRPHPLGSLPTRSGISLLTAESGITTTDMLGVKISALPAASAATAIDQLEANQAGTSRRVTVAQVAAAVAGTLPPPDMSGYLPLTDGVVGDGVTNDTAALQVAFDEAAGSVMFLQPGTYKFTSLSIPAGTTVMAAGAVFRSSGTFNNIAVPSIDVGANCTIDELTYSTPATEIHKCAVFLGEGVKVGRLAFTTEAAAMPSYHACETLGQDVEIGFLYSLRFDYPLTVNPTTVGQTTGFKLGGAYINSYKRGIFLNDTARYAIGPTHFEVMSPNASKSPGQNGILLGGAPNGSIADCYIADAGEHAFRIGGSPVSTRTTKNVTIGMITAIRCGGCALKINPTVLVSPGVTETADNISVVGVHGVDVGKLAAGAGNSEFLRITHARDCYIGWASVERDQFTYSCQYALQINDTNGLWIGSLSANDAAASMINFDQAQDVDGVSQFGGSVANLHIGELVGNPGAGTNLIGTTMSSFTLGSIYIGGLDITTLVTRLLSVGGAQVFTGPFHIAGRIGGSVAPLYSGVDDPLITYDIVWGNNHTIGRPAASRNTSRLEIDALTFDSTNVSPAEPFIRAVYGTPAVNAYGPAIGLSRVGSGRRGAAIATKQTGASGFNTGLAFFTGGSTTATDLVSEAGFFDHLLALNLNGALTGTTATFSAAPAYPNDSTSVATTAFVTDAIAAGGGGGSGTVTSTSVVSANGLAGSVATPTTTPAITLTTSVNGMVKGNGTALSAAVADTDYLTPTTAGTTYQPLDADLTAVAALSTTGVMARSAANTYTMRTITGTASRVSLTNGNGVSGNPTIDIDSGYVGQTSITTLGTVATGTWQGTVVAGQYGGTGVNNSTRTITIGGNLTTSGAFNSTFTMTGTTTVTFPTTGTLATTANLSTYAPLAAPVFTGDAQAVTAATGDSDTSIATTAFVQAAVSMVPQNAQTGNYTAVLADAGKHIYHAVGAGAGDTYTIPANASVAYPIGTTLTFVNDDATNAVTIAITTDTMVLSPGTTTGSRTLATGGIATAIKVTSTRWVINGSGLT